MEGGEEDAERRFKIPGSFLEGGEEGRVFHLKSKPDTENTAQSKREEERQIKI